MSAHRVSLLLLSAILNFITINGNQYYDEPRVHGVSSNENHVPHQPASPNQPTTDDLLDLLKEKLRNQVIIQNINRRSGASNNQESPLKGLRTFWQNNEEKFVNPNSQQLERLSEHNSGKTAMQNVLERLRPNGGRYGVNPIIDLLPQNNRGQFVLQDVNRKSANFLKNNPVAALGSNLLQREQLVLQNIGRPNVLSPTIANFLERLTKNNRGQLVVQSVNRPTSAHLFRQPEEYFAQHNNDNVPLSLQQHNHHQIASHNDKQKNLHPEISFLNPLFEPDTLQLRERPTSQSIGERPSPLNFGNIEIPRLQLPGQIVIQRVKGLSKHKNSYLNSLLEEIKGHNGQITIPFVNPNKQNNEHRYGPKYIVDHKNYVTPNNNNNFPFNHHVDDDDRNYLMTIFVEKYIPEYIRRILYFPKTKAEREKVQMLLKNYKVITYAFADFLRYSNPLAGYIKSLRIISEHIKQKAKNRIVPIHIIQKELDDLSQLGVDNSGFKVKKIGSNPDVLVEDLSLKVKDLLKDKEPFKHRPSNMNEEPNTEIYDGIDENNDTNQDLNVLPINEAPFVIGLKHHKDKDDVLHHKHPDENIDNNNNSRSEEIPDKPYSIHQKDKYKPHRPEIDTDEQADDTDLKGNEIQTGRPNLKINTLIEEIFCQSLNVGEVIDIMEEVLYNVMGELNERFRLDDVILNVTRQAITKTLQDKNLYSHKRCEKDYIDF